MRKYRWWSRRWRRRWERQRHHLKVTEGNQLEKQTIETWKKSTKRDVGPSIWPILKFSPSSLYICASFTHESFLYNKCLTYNFLTSFVGRFMTCSIFVQVKFLGIVFEVKSINENSIASIDVLCQHYRLKTKWKEPKRSIFQFFGKILEISHKMIAIKWNDNV